MEAFIQRLKIPKFLKFMFCLILNPIEWYNHYLNNSHYNEVFCYYKLVLFMNFNHNMIFHNIFPLILKFYLFFRYLALWSYRGCLCLTMWKLFMLKLKFCLPLQTIIWISWEEGKALAPRVNTILSLIISTDSSKILNTSTPSIVSESIRKDKLYLPSMLLNQENFLSYFITKD